MSLGLGLTRILLANQAAHCKYYNPVTRKKVWQATLQAGTALGTALTATAVTMTLYNPVGSTVRLILMQVRVAITGVQGAGEDTYVLAANLDPTAAVPATVTPVTPRNCLLGETALPSGLVYSAATLPAVPEAVRVVGSSYFATAVAMNEIAHFDDVDGAIVLAPNTAVTLQNIGIGATGIVSMMWEEVPYSA